ncbi:MAG TPA: 50S ribosomal protein L3 N(5)-glutamine methyltransferase [Opitutaceae bacterium]|jgi:ribosomal protein L3 glutamine methyltransferase|nr:50S ribosomal protein L3 N(5)-glutamine methyltransferase [Opitutaceae bacterium]
MKRSRTPEDPLAGADRLRTFGQWWRFAERLYERHGLALGQVAGSAHDESLFLLLRVLDWPLSSGPAALKRALTAEQRRVLREAVRRRVIERVPAAYITREAWLGGSRFYIDERVIIPRSYFVELIPTQLEPWLPAGVPVRHAADVCTGSGCLAILLAEQFPRAKVDAIDLSADALAVAAINCREHRVARRVSLHQSDVFGAVPPVRYDLIVSNPPYEPSALVDRLPPEFQAEPRLALDGGADGLAIVRRLIAQARTRLQPHGILAIEIGALHGAVEREFAAYDPHWLHTADGSDCVVLFQAARLQPGLRARAGASASGRKGRSPRAG